MSDPPSRLSEPAPAASPGGILACCSAVYGSPLAELVVGESLHPGGIERTRQLLAASRLSPGERLLDAGCGLGASSRLAAAEFGLVVDAVDARAEVLARAEGRPVSGRIRWSQADLLGLPCRTASFDGVLAECVLSTVPRQAALAEIRRVLRPGGQLLLSDVEVSGDPIPALEDHRLLGAALCLADAWRAGEFEALLPAAGFAIEHRWDWTESILALVDRVEARISLATAAARDLGLDLGVLAGEKAGEKAGDSGLLQPERAHRLADDIREAVRRGDLRYVAVVARTLGHRHGRRSVSGRTARWVEPPQTVRS